MSVIFSNYFYSQFPLSSNPNHEWYRGKEMRDEIKEKKVMTSQKIN